MKTINSYLSLFILLAALIPAALPDTVQAQENMTEIFQPDGSGGLDTYMSFAEPTTNYGSSETMVVGDTGGAASWYDVENTSASIVYSGSFSTGSDASDHGGSMAYSNDTDLYFSYTTLTTGFRFYSRKSYDLGIVEIFIDDVSVGTYDLYDAGVQYQQLIYSVEDLDYDTHVIRVNNSGTKNASSSGYYMSLDYLSSYTLTNTSRGLIAFDLSTLPPDAGVINATLSLWVADDLATSGSTLQAFVVTRPWGEATATFEQYNYDYGYAYSYLWQIAGAEGDDDRLQDPSGEVTLSGDLTPGTRVDIVLTPADVDNMIRANYFGIVLRTMNESNDAYSFYTSDYDTDPDKRPMLTIDYNPSPPIVDPGWLCVESSWDCPPLLDTTTVYKPFRDTDQGTAETTYGQNFEGWNTSRTIGAKLNCTPYPLCKNDFPIYYRITYFYSWAAQNNISYAMQMTTLEQGDESNLAQVYLTCHPETWQASGTCKGTMQGVLDPEQITTTAMDADFYFKVHMNVPTEYPTNTTASFKVYLSLEPFSEQCADTYQVPSVDTYNIDPTIETPVGMVGAEPPDDVDEQGYPTVIDQMYMLRVQNGPWNDGTDDRYDTAVSVDGTTYETLEDFSIGENVLCIEVDFENPYWLTVYFTATTETFYIRVNDVAAAFANNTNDAETPLQYVIGWAFPIDSPIDCSDQFTDDETVGSLTLDATSEEEAVDAEIIPNEWYGIEVASGTWTDAPSATERIDMEFKFDAGGNRLQWWQVLQEGSHLVYCEATDRNIIYVQAMAAEGQQLSLRVNDQDSPTKNWADNDGALQINVYHETFTRAPHDCELGYNLGDLITHDTVAANATNGKLFGLSLMVGGTLMTGSLTPGAIYVLDTTDGPWWQTYTGGGYNANEYYFDVKVKTLLGEWSTLENWTESLCVATLDGLGHQRVYFKVPETSNIEYYIKVGGASPVGRGEMGWNLYYGYDNGNTGEDCSNFQYDPEEDWYGDYVNSGLENGQDIAGLDVPDAYYAIEVKADAEAEDPPDYRKSGWWEYSGAETEKDTLQITRDGTNWDTPENSSNVLCYFNLPSGNLVFFIKTSNGVLENWKMRADSDSFNDNVGYETYSLFHASADGLDPWISCLQDYTASLPALNSAEYIPVRQEEGIRLLPMETSPEVIDTNGDGLIMWGNLWLPPNHYYEVETLHGDWNDGDEEVVEDGKAAELSSDDGVTWYSFAAHPDVICYHQEANPERYWKAIFEVTEGQKWRIRVADSAGNFTDNGGALAYALYLINEFPGCVFDCDGTPVDPITGLPETFDACILALVKPEPLTLSEIANLGNYLGDWVEYIQQSMLAYFAWCQRHTDIVIGAIGELKTKEPIGSIVELETISENIQAEVESYDWDNSGTEGMDVGPVDTSIFDFGNSDGVGPFVSSAEGANSIFDQYVMPQSGQAYDVWDGGDVVDFGNQTGLPDYYYTCNTVFTDYLPSKLRTGTCFASAYWKETGASFWIQLLLDIGAVFLMFRMIKSSIQSLVYMMTGVRIWTKDGAVAITVAAVNEYRGTNEESAIQPIDKWRWRPKR